VALDEGSTRSSQIVFQDKSGEDQGLPAQETSSLGAVVDDTDHGRGSPSKWFRFLLSAHVGLNVSPHQMRILEILDIPETEKSSHRGHRGVRVDIVLVLALS
jgi:hypothetical protein